MSILRLDHIQLAMPRGEEDKARGFFVDVLGFTEIPKPDALAGRGGLWLQAGSVELHMGVEDDFRPALKAHPAFLVDDLDGLAERLRAAGHPVKEDAPIKGTTRFFSEDCFGNRLEFLQAG